MQLFNFKRYTQKTYENFDNRMLSVNLFNIKESYDESLIFRIISHHHALCYLYFVNELVIIYF